MRLFLLAVLGVAWVGCSKGDDLKAGALSIKIHYESFRPGCVTLEASDRDDVARHTVATVKVPAGQRQGTLSVAVFRQSGWSQNVRLRAVAREQGCDGAQVAEAVADAEIPGKGVSDPVELTLRAVDADDDGFVSTSSGGTDCDDQNGAVGGPKVWYTDEDGDGYGSRYLPPSEPSCQRPALTSASRAGDCDDRDRLVHPDQEEFRCDGKDDNCNDQIDEVFALGGECKNAFACPGANTCDMTDGGVTCFSTIQPTAYFFDEDGDGEAGADGGVTCGPPPPGTTAEYTDCDESSVYMAMGKFDVCDRMDNDCNGTVDDGAPCKLDWQGVPGGGSGQPKWNAIAVGQDMAWLAGDGALADAGNVLKIQGDGGTSLSLCSGSWSTAWVSASGQVFLGGGAGKLASKLPEQADCTLESTPDALATITGIMGFNASDGGSPTLYAVSSGGVVYRWIPPAAPVQFATLGINLRAVHGTTATEPLRVVGARDYNLPVKEPHVFRVSVADGSYVDEPLPAAVTGIYLTGVSVVNARFAYAVGDNGVFLEWTQGKWQQRTAAPANVNLTDVVAFGQKAIYATSVTGEVLFFNGTNWTTAYLGSRAMRSIDATSPTRIGAAGVQGTYQFFNRP
ncbi:putative metal-binding motif-containing protein [Corallococcus sp. Z5C101001]|uniref:putative metal-binding motif-containing protein n=1 Tax=Corallococcus sp. Z5C101001 TaxID=2596829 RepID=UPI00117ECCE7|nr:putative metal-binding motif-containing protein [Corallococcus sp. Z5C101001]TSC26727.1 hypothetical protein FOF48_21925 [Corallococcus sp. Z5C101001]